MHVLAENRQEIHKESGQVRPQDRQKLDHLGKDCHPGRPIYCQQRETRCEQPHAGAREGESGAKTDKHQSKRSEPDSRAYSKIASGDDDSKSPCQDKQTTSGLLERNLTEDNQCRHEEGYGGGQRSQRDRAPDTPRGQIARSDDNRQRPGHLAEADQVLLPRHRRERRNDHRDLAHGHGHDKKP